ncbi:hypothetical protein CSV74_07570 [Sporosarcina sp. P19]|uniref:O-antigen ligase family protein n=1 Tax=Sporosarcina sp. P19 TaxID=2048258 RepID=UPI000C1677F3|nr:O-antigen ligase family protein [Sporosarcina sp. P19]PIC77122.1 hypothetical protein CSV74_07570 [Sporosarcina sp. P19]
MDFSQKGLNSIFLILIILILLTLFLPPITLPVAGSSLTVYIGEIFLLLTIVLWIISLMCKRTITFNNIGKYSIFFIFAGFFSLINIVDLGRYSIGLLGYFEAMFLILMFSDIKLKTSAKLIKYYIYSGCILASFIIYETIFKNNGEFLIGNKIVLSIGASNYLASILLLPFFVSLTKLLKGKHSFINLVCLTLISIGIIFTASRSAIIIIIIFTLLYVQIDLLSNKKSLIRKISSLLLILLGAGVVYIEGKSFLFQMINTGRFENLSEQSNFLTRLEIFREYYLAFLKSPIVGNGYFNIKANFLGEYTLAHNFILQLLGDNGIIGFSIFIILLFYIYRFLKSSYKTVVDNNMRLFILGFKRSFLVILLHGMVEPNIGSRLFMIYLFIGVGIIITSVSYEKRYKSISSNN